MVIRSAMPLVQIRTCFCICLCTTVIDVSVSISLCLSIGCCIYLALWKYDMCSLTPDCPNVQKFRVRMQITRSNTWMLHSCVSHGVWECVCFNTRTCMRVLKFVRSITRVHVCVCICIFIYSSILPSTCIHPYAMRIYVYVYLHIFTYPHTNTLIAQ